jgi:hypothetical protein
VKQYSGGVPLFPLSRRAQGIKAQAENDAPRTVHAEDLETTLDAVREMIRNRVVIASDLIDLGDGWQTVGDCPPLIDDISPRIELEQEAATMAKFGKMLLTFAALGAAFWIAFR